MNPITDLYKLPNIAEYENVHLLSLSENCAVLEEKVLAIARTLPEHSHKIISEYIAIRNDLETETFKTALQWGKQNYR